jgi:threonine dehydratase
MTALPGFADIESAEVRLRPYLSETPLLFSHDLSERTGGSVYVKAESLQKTGSFKIRGALNRLAQLTEDEKSRGVIAWSSGNHAQGVAQAAKVMGTRAIIVMPSDAPEMKVANARQLGAEIIAYNRATEDREAIARQRAARDGLVTVPPFDDADVIAGQGTVGAEIIRQCGRLGVTVDDIYVPVSGGGLVAGLATAVLAKLPGARVFAVEPEAYDDHRRSLEAGRPVRNPSSAAALCDGLLAPEPGRLTWEINRRALAGAFAVSDTMVMAAVQFAFNTMKLVLEPSGAVALAALLSGRHASKGRTAVVVLSGGNVDPEVFIRCIGVRG